MTLALSSILFWACSSDDNASSSKERYYVKYTLTGNSWYRPPFGHSHNKQAVPSSIKYQGKNGIEETSESGSINFSKVVGPVDKNFKAVLSASNSYTGLNAAYFDGTIEILKDGNQLVGSSSDSGEGYIYVTCDIAILR